MLSTAEIIVIAFVAGGLFGIVLTAFFRALEIQKTPVLRDILIKMKQNPVFTKEETDIIMEIYDDIRKKAEKKKKALNQANRFHQIALFYSLYPSYQNDFQYVSMAWLEYGANKGLFCLKKRLFLAKVEMFH